MPYLVDISKMAGQVRCSPGFIARTPHVTALPWLRELNLAEPQTRQSRLRQTSLNACVVFSCRGS